MKAKSHLYRKLRARKYVKCTKCGIQLRGKKPHECRVRHCDYCLFPWKRHHERMCLYWKKQTAIKAEAKKKRRHSHYVTLGQVGFLGEEAVTPDTDFACCRDKQRVLGDSEEAFITAENGSIISFVLAPPGYIGMMTIDESKTRLREVPSDFHAIILAAQAPVKQSSTFLLTLTIADPDTLQTNALVRCNFRAELPEYLPLYQIGDVLRVHRGLLTDRSKDGKRLTISAAGSAAAWVVFDSYGNVRSESGSTHSMTAFEQNLLEKYTQFAKTLNGKTENCKIKFQGQGEAVSKDYAEISKGIFVPALYDCFINENDLTSISGTCEIMY